MVESDISFISSEAIRLALHEIGEELTKSSEFEIHLKSATKQGDNFLGIVHRVTYKNQSDENSESTLILKVAPTNPARREAFGSRKFFLREIHLYNDILSYFEEFQRIKCINIQRDGFKEYAKCYKSIDIEPNESLLLEDLSANGFNMIDRHTDVITADHVKLVMQSLGKFHAISFAIKDQEPNKFKELTSNLEEILFGKTQHHFRKHFDHLQRKTMSVIAGTELFDKVNIEDSFFDMAAQCVDGELAEPYAVLCHSDTWSNNTLFKCDATGKPADVRLIDWQISRYASPVTDILYYIFGCVGTELRTSHYDIFLRAYHDSLSSYLKRLILSVKC